MSPEKLVMMANQIGRFFQSQSGVDTSTAVAEHLVKFWDPRMREAILVHVDAAGPAGLDPPVAQAIEQLRSRT